MQAHHSTKRNACSALTLRANIRPRSCTTARRRRGAQAGAGLGINARDLETSLTALGGIKPAFAAVLKRAGLRAPLIYSAGLRHGTIVP
jgi:hypothetical protein